MKGEYPLRFSEARPDAAAHKALLPTNRLPLWLILDGLTDPRNIGSMFRLADAARLAGIILVGMEQTMHPGKVQKVSRSTIDLVPHIFFNGWTDFQKPANDVTLLALEWTNQSLPYHQFNPAGPLGLIIGNEQHGVSPEALKISSGSIHIPMLGLNSSMNVSMATGIAVYGLLEKGGLL